MKLKQQLTVAVLVFCIVLAGCSGTDTQTTPIETTTDRQTTDTQTGPTDSERNAERGNGTGTDTETSTESETETATRTETETKTRTETTPVGSTQTNTQTEAPPTDTQTEAPPTNTQTETDTQTEIGTDTQTETGTDESPDETENADGVESPIDGGTARQAVVTRVVDGDTVEVRFTNGEVDTVRLIGVDTPETSLSNQNPSEYGIPDTPLGSDWLLMWGENAESFANSELAGTEVLVVTDPEGDTRGYYGRLLAYIYYSDGENFGHILLERGYARVYTGAEFTLEGEYVQAESVAQDANEGLWAYEEDTTPTPTPTSTPTETSTPAPTSTPTPTETSSEVVTPPLPADGDYDCGHFDTHEQAQEVFNDNEEDVYRLDGDNDGEACESLP